MNFDFKTYMDNFINKDLYNELLERKGKVLEKFNTYDMTGWKKDSITKSDVEKIKDIASVVRDTADVFLVLGIGGSYLGSASVIDAFKPYFRKGKKPEILFGGINMSSEYLKELLAYIEDKDVVVNVISKSGTTMEISVAFDLVYKKLQEKYTEEELQKRIIITTDEHKGKLRELVESKNYKSFIIPDNIGGRFSVTTPAGLLPIAVSGIDIDKFLEGYNNALKYEDIAYNYACIRNTLYKENKKIENFVVYEPKLYYFTEWLKQLFGESEGKNGKGLFLTSTVYTRDLHSLGQFMQDGSDIIFETVIRLKNSTELPYNDNDINKMNYIITDSVATAHYNGHTPTNMITLENFDEKTLGELIYFFLLAASFSSILLGVNPFDQPGVESYKQEVKKHLS